MNKNRFLLFSLTFCLSVFIFSCDKQWKEPEFEVPEYSVIRSYLRTTSYIKGLHVNGTAPDSILPPPREIYIEGYVVSSDEGGNFFKSIVVQDRSGGIEMRLDKTGLHTEYPVGQKVYISCRNLVIGDYGNYPQLGVLYEGGVGRLHQLLIPKHIHKNGLPNMKEMYEFLGEGYQGGRPMKITNRAEMAANVGKLVMIPDCRFDVASIGAPLAYNDIDYTSHTVYFGDASIVLRTSSYAKFRNSITCQDKPFTLFGIISVYGSTYQFTVRTAEDVDYNNSGAPQPLNSYTFNQNSLTTGGWRVSDNTSVSKWEFVESDKCMFHRPVSAGADRCDDWLISPPIQIDDRNGVSMYLDHKINFTGLQDYYKVYYSVNDNGNIFNPADWQELGNLSVFPNPDFALSNAFNISIIPNSTFRIAIRFHKSADAAANRWSIREVKFTR